MGLLQIKQDGIYVDGNLKIPANSDYYLQKMEEDLHFKTINGEKITGEGDIIAGSVLQVRTLISPDDRYYFNSEDEVELPGLNCDFTPKSDSSTIIVISTVVVTKPYVYSFALKYGDKWINPPSSNNEKHENSYMTGYFGSDNTRYLMNYTTTVAFKNDTTETTYLGLYMKSKWTDSVEFYYNDRKDNDMRSRSYMHIFEVKGDSE